MTERPNFDRQYIENELQKLAATLVEKNTVFVAGGAAMAFYGLKEATRDIDVVPLFWRFGLWDTQILAKV